MSRSDKLAAFVEAVRASKLLPAEDLARLERAAADPAADPEALARELVQAGRLTAYQARALWRGQGPDLFLTQYVLLDKLGEGGMGEVFRARQTSLDRDVALKVMRREKLANPEAVRRFRREIQATATLAHPNVVRAFDADQAGDVHFFAMEFVDGTTLDRLVQDRGPLPVGEACDYVRQAALGLQHAHEQGLVHRDVKPANLLVDKAGVVKITDLGLVLIDDPAGGPGGSRITREGLTVGTPDYLAPEQARDPRGADIRADVYALGCTFYFALAGQVPFPGGTPTEKMLRHAREDVPAPARADLPAGVRAVLAKMTARKPERRYQTPNEVAEALAPFAVAKGAPPAPPPLPAAAAEGITADDLPVPPRRSERRPARPAETARPRARRAGCLPLVLAVGAGVAVLVWRGGI